MGALAVIIFSVFWAVVGCGGPFVVPKGPNQGLFKVMVTLTAVCCYTFWLLCYLHQMNPLIGPQLNAATISWLGHRWGPFIWEELLIYGSTKTRKAQAMGNAGTFSGVTVAFAAVGILGPLAMGRFRKGPNTGIAQTMLVMISVCCWLFWTLAFLHQVNPLLGPQLKGTTVLWLAKVWGKSPVLQPDSS